MYSFLHFYIIINNRNGHNAQKKLLNIVYLSKNAQSLLTDRNKYYIIKA